MHWKQIVNRQLSEATGYVIVRREALERRPKRRPQPRPKPPRQPPPKPPAPPPAPHFDEEARQMMLAARPRTMTSDTKLFSLIVATRHVVRHGIEGAIVECGVWRGGSMQVVAWTLLGMNAAGRDLYLFDTFEGMPPPEAQDVRFDGRPAEALLEETPRTGNVWAVAGLDDVRAGMAETGYPAERVHCIAGRVEETLPEHAPDSIALLRLDTDWYGSTRHELDHLYDRVPSGGIIIFDDYDYWVGARKAVDEFFEQRGERLLLVPMASGRIAVKP